MPAACTPPCSWRGQSISASNSTALLAALKDTGIEKINVRRVKDDKVSLHKALEAALAESDFVITSGGVSVGDFDFVKDVAVTAGVRTVFWKIAIKPGMPNYFSIHSGAGVDRGTLVPAPQDAGVGPTRQSSLPRLSLVSRVREARAPEDVRIRIRRGLSNSGNTVRYFKKKKKKKVCAFVRIATVWPASRHLADQRARLSLVLDDQDRLRSAPRHFLRRTRGRGAAPTSSSRGKRMVRHGPLAGELSTWIVPPLCVTMP